MSDICNALSAPFDPSIVSWRVGPTTNDKSKGMALAYIDARDVMRRLDEVCGPENWQDEYPWSDGKRVVCRIGIKLDGEWIWKTDGAGDTDTEGEKGALSDAFKRSAVKWGIGRYLYDTESPWVEIEQRGKSYVIKQSEFGRLRSSLPGARRTGNGTGAAGTAAARGNATNVSVLPPSPEGPPEVAAARNRVRALIGKLDQHIKTAPSDHALDVAWDDARAELAEIEAVTEPVIKNNGTGKMMTGVEVGKDLRARYNRRVSELRGWAAA